MINIDRYLSQMRNVPALRWAYLGMSEMATQVNQLATNVGADTQTRDNPPQVAGLTVKSSGTGLVHAVINDPANISRNLQYFLEYDTNPAFTQPQVEHLGASRSRVLRLPGMTDDSSSQNFYFRAYSQYPGSKPSPAVVYGGANGATPVAPGGTDTLTLLPSTGSGTAPNNGLVGGSGLGRNLHRTL